MLPTTVLLGFLTVFGGVGHTHATPIVTLDNATVTGVASGLTNQFLGIPFAQPPTGNFRFRLPRALPPYDTNFFAFDFGPSCPQQSIVHLPSNVPTEIVNYLAVFLTNSLTSSEDCLTLNVVTPADTTPDSKLPVLVWIYPGAFEFGGTPYYDVSTVVEKSIMLGSPIIFVSINFRQNAFGFLASQEVKDAGVGNLGLQDQRLALRWVQKYVSAFGGDPTQVTIWGCSSGSISVALHMLTNGGNQEGLFRAAFMQSGVALSVGDITHGQPYYDALVAETGCTGANDTLQCLREVPYDRLLRGVSQSPGILAYQGLHIAWGPRVDGVFLTTNPLDSLQQGAIADIPFISGNSDDEGTLFTLANLNITTDEEFAEYINTNYFPNASKETIAQVMKYYPSDPTKGSPYNTGHLNALTPQFKRLASFQGDFAFHTTRRLLLQVQSGKQRVWTYLNKRLKFIPLLGAFHSSDLLNVELGFDMDSYLVRFVANLDPNVGKSSDLYWPQYDATNQAMLEFTVAGVPQSLTTDTFRVEEIAYLTNVMLANPL